MTLFENDFENFLETATAASKLNVHSGKRTLKDLLDYSFNLTKVVRIENTSSYSDSISYKGAELTLAINRSGINRKR